MASKFEILLQARLDKTNSDAQIRQDIKSLEKKLSLNLDLKADSKSATQIKNAISGVGSAAKDAKKHTQDLDDIIGKFSTWQIVGDVIHGVKDAIIDMVDQVFELDASLTELDKVTDLTSDGLEKLADDAFAVGEQIGATGKDVIDATTIFAQAGYEAQEALDLGEQAIMLMNVSEAGATAADSASTLIAAMKAFGLEAEDSGHIVDALNEVSNKYAVSVNDLSTAISKSSASMAAGNNSLEETFGLVTAGVEILREPGRVANGLSTITARLTAKNDEYIKSITKGQGVIDEQTGELRSTYDILKDLSEAWEGLTSVEQQELAETVAGKTQRSLFTAIMTNFESAVGATEAALNSEGSAMAENTKRMDSLEGRTKQLQSAWQDFARNTINSEVVKSIISLGTQIIKLADSDIGRMIIAIASLSVAMKGLKAAMSFLSKTKTISSVMNTFYYNLLLTSRAAQMAGVSVSGFNLAVSAGIMTVKAFTAALLANPLTWIIVAIGAVTTAISYFNDKAEEARETAKELSTQYQEEAEEGEELLQTYQELSDKTSLTNEESQKLKETIDELNKSYGVSKEELAAEGKERDKTIAKIQKEIEERKKMAALQAQTSVDWDTKFLGLFGTDEKEVFNSTQAVEIKDIGRGGLGEEYDLVAESVGELQKKLKDYIETLQNKSDKTKEEEKDLETLLNIYGKVSEQVTKVREGYSNALDLYNEGIPITTEQANVLFQLGDITKEEALAVGVYNEKVAENTQLTEEQKEVVWDELKAELDRKDTVEGLTEAEANSIDTLGEKQEAVLSLSETIDELQNSYNTLISVVDEYNENGYLSIDTLQSLLSLSDDYLAMLSFENGQLTLNTQALDAKTNALIAARVEQLQAAAVADIYALAEGNAENMSELAQTAIEGVGTGATNMKTDMENAIPTIGKFTQALLQAKAAAGEDTDVDNFEEKADAIINSYKDVYNNITKLGSGSYYSGGKENDRNHSYSGNSKGSSGSSSKSSADTYKAEINTLYKYENALDNAKDAVDRLNDALDNTDNFEEQEKILKQLIDATNDEIDATEDLKDAQVDQINDYIRQLKKYGFQINYNSKTNELYIKNMDRLGKYTGDTAKKLEEMIEEIQDLNDDNRDLDSSIRDLTGDIKDFNEQLDELPTEKLEKFHDLLEEFQQSRLDQIQNEIDDIQHDMDNDPRLQALEEQIEALEKQNDELDNQKDLEEKLLAVEEAKIKLQNAQNEKNIQVYREGQGWVK